MSEALAASRPSVSEALAASASAEALLADLSEGLLDEALALSSRFEDASHLALLPGVKSHFTRLANELRCGAISAQAILKRRNVAMGVRRPSSA